MQPYHMRRSDREITEGEELAALLRAGKFAVIAMCKGDEPYVVSLSYGYDASANALYFHCASEGQKLDFLAANPRVCATIVIDGGYVDGKCKHKYESVVIRGTMALVADDAAKRHALGILLTHLEPDPAPMLEKYLANAEGVAKVAMLKLDIEDITGKKGS